MSDWAPIKSAPRDGSYIIIATHPRGVPAGRYNQHVVRWIPSWGWRANNRDIDEDYETPMFWRPKPEDPA